MPEMHLRHPASPDKSGFTYSACGTFIRNKEKIQNFKETGVHGISIKTNQIKHVSTWRGLWGL